MNEYGGWSLVNIVKLLSKRFDKIESELEEINKSIDLLSGSKTPVKKIIKKNDDNTDDTGN